MMQSKMLYGFAALIFVAGSIIRIVGFTVNFSVQFELLLLSLIPVLFLLTAGVTGVASAPAICCFNGYLTADMMYRVLAGTDIITPRELVILSCFAVPSAFLCAGCCVTTSLRLIRAVFFHRKTDLQPAANSIALCTVCAVMTFSVYLFGIK